ncbi:MAG: zinc-binding dehydrogenase [Pseudomonadota bacterium]
MKAIVFERHGGVEELKYVDAPEPDVGAGEVLVRVRAAALNGFDPMMLQGSTKLKTPFPMIPCGDFAGEIAGLGSDVQGGWSVGDRVSGYPILPEKGMMGEVTSGAACEYVVMPESCLVRVPASVSFEHAAALPVAYGTAYRMMGVRGAVKAGERVLILGATGGVGAACIQLAKAAGAEVVACGGGGWKLDKLKEVGADHVIDTAEEDFLAAVRDRFGKPSYDGTGDGGVDVVVNYIGGDTWAKALKTVRKHGRILVCGATAGHDPQTDLRYIWSFEQTVVGSNGWTIDDQDALTRMTASGALTPAIHDVRPLEELPSLMTELIERKVFGKAVVSI